MKLPFIAAIAFIGLAVSAWTPEVPSGPRELHPPYLEVFVINPPHPIDWSSPRALLKTTLRNGVTLDYAPNGHLAVHIRSRYRNAYGINEILTGMGRTNKVKTMWDTFYRQYGLSAMIHDFSGDLESSETTLHEINKAKKAHRLAVIRVQLTDASAERLMNFMDQWIRYGSYLHYGGNKNVPKGEGSGCADFGVHFIELAMNGRLPSDDWNRTVYLPYELLQEAPGRAPRKIPLTEILNSEAPWAVSEEGGLKFSIPDPEKMTKWIKSVSPFTQRVTIFPEEDWTTESASLPLERFAAPYPRQPDNAVQDKWTNISHTQ